MRANLVCNRGIEVRDADTNIGPLRAQLTPPTPYGRKGSPIPLCLYIKLQTVSRNIIYTNSGYMSNKNWFTRFSPSIAILWDYWVFDFLLLLVRERIATERILNFW